MGSDEEKPDPYTILKLPLFSMSTPNHLTEPSGTSTPPLQTSASVPFRWEEQPGKPRPCTDIILASTINPTRPERCLELPPRLAILESNNIITKTTSPTTVLDGPGSGDIRVGKEDQAMPYLLFLQGGPGFESPRPTEASGWLSKACEQHRVILLDQRGTGLSTPLTTSSMLQLKSAQELVDYLKYFRADNIVNDAEFIRKLLVPDAAPWKVLGQSFGGFCGVTYLSFAPQGLKEVFLTGGIPPIGDGCTAESVNRACIGPIVIQNEKYYKRYPQDIEIIRDVVNHLAESEGGGVPLPSGGILTPKGLQLLGLTGLGSSTGFERLHYLFERVWDPVIVPGAKKQISYYFLNSFEKWLGFDTNPLYALMHESIYCQGAASRWAAQRVREEHESKLDAVKAAKEGRPVFLTGEMVFPWMFDEIHALKPFKEAANLLAEKKDWPPLYNKTTLNNNKVPVAAAVYYEDMFVNFNLASETAGQIAGIRLWVTNEYMHSGLRDGAHHVLDHLMRLLNGKKPLF